MVSPHFESIRCQNSLSRYSHFEIQAIREYADAHGDHYIQSIEDFQDPDTGQIEPYNEEEDEEAVGPVMFGVYGRYTKNSDGICLARHITDLVSLEAAREFVRDLNGESSDIPEQERGKYLAIARENYVANWQYDDNIQIYDNADIRSNDQGDIWVEAYVYLYQEESEDESKEASHAAH